MEAQILPKPSEILRRPEHAEHWYRQNWSMTLMRPDNSHLEPVKCMCAAEILYEEAVTTRDDIAAQERMGLLGSKEGTIAFVWGVSEDVVIEGINVNDELPNEQARIFSELSHAIHWADTQEEHDNAKRSMYDFLRGLAPERLEAVASHYEKHGF